MSGLSSKIKILNPRHTMCFHHEQIKGNYLFETNQQAAGISPRTVGWYVCFATEPPELIWRGIDGLAAKDSEKVLHGPFDTACEAALFRLPVVVTGSSLRRTP